MIKLLLPILLLVAVRVFAAGVNDMYSERELANDKARYERRIDEMFSQRLWTLMKGKEKQALANVRIEHPLKGEGPLDAFSGKRHGIPTVVLPVLTLKFIEDLSIAYAWRYAYGYSLEPIDEYLAMLKYRRPEDFPSSRVPDPLTALGVPPRIWEQDKRVDDLSLRVRNTAWAFILAHELEHLRRKHPGYHGVPPKVTQRNEMEADAFAMDLFRRSDEIPTGMLLWFQASVGYFPNRADFGTEAEYRDWLQGKLDHPKWGKVTHPANPDRLKSLAVALNRAADASLDRKHTEVLRFIAGKLVQIGDILAEPDMQRLIARCAALRHSRDLKRLEDRPCD